jgi:hypothetical protein
MNKSKIKVANEIKHITYDDAINDLVILYENKNMSYINIKNKHYGNKLLDYYFFPYRLNTITKKHITFYEFYFKKLYNEHGNFKTFLKYAEKNIKLTILLILYMISFGYIMGRYHNLVH